MSDASGASLIMKPGFWRLSAARVAMASGALIVFLTSNGLAQSASFNAQSYPLLGNNHVAADFNGDGRLDLAGTGANAVSLMLNNGNGTFGPRTNFAIAAQTQSITAGDFDLDGRMDAVEALNDPQLGFALLRGTGTGSFNAPVYFPNTSGFDSPAVIATDLNNDSRLDLVILHNIACFTAPCRAARSITALLGNGDGTFQKAHEIDVGVLPHAMAAEDFNRDGIKDLAIGGENTELRILLGAGDGTFVAQPIMQLVPGGDLFSACNDVDVADFNRDGLQDLVVPLGNGRGNAILIGNGNGAFQVAQRITVNETFAPLNVAVADYNRDGFEDIARAMGDGTNGLIEILHGNGNATFQPPVRYLVPPSQSSVGGIFITSSDFNGDGKPDIALEVGGANPSLRILINSTNAPGPTPTPTPSPSLTITGLSLNPTSVIGGAASTGTVTLSAPAQAATTVTLARNNAAASVPTSVTVAAGASSANFTVGTTQVSSATTVTVTASLNGTSRSATLTINPPATATDRVSITRAEYKQSSRELRIEATSTRSNAILKAHVTSSNALIGTLSNDGGGKYSLRVTWSSNPQQVTVRSNLGGSATSAVSAR